VVQPTDQRKLDYPTHLGYLDWAWMGRVLAKRQVRAARLVVIRHELAQQPSKVSLVQHDHMVEQLSA